MLTRLARWWIARSERRRAPDVDARVVGECTTCAADLTADQRHTLVSLADDDAVLGIEGQTAMSADYCGGHCPGGCTRGCAKIAA